MRTHSERKERIFSKLVLRKNPQPQPRGKTSRLAGHIFLAMRIQRSINQLDPRDLKRLAQERAFVDALFARLAEDVQRLQSSIARLHQIQFFTEAAWIMEETMAARILLQILEMRLIRLSQDWRIPEDSSRFLLLETTVHALAANALRTLANQIAQGRVSLPFGSDEHLRTWATILAASDAAKESSYAEAARILQEAAHGLPQIRQLA